MYPTADAEESDEDDGVGYDFCWQDGDAGGGEP